MNSAESATPIYYDRSTGLMVFGILTIGLGGLAGLMAFLIPVTQLMTERLHDPAVSALPLSVMVPACAVYVMISAGLIWLGIGSCLYRRWARAILCVFSWSWLVVGVIAIISAAVILPGTLSRVMSASAQMHGRPPPPAGVDAVLMVFIFGFYGIVFVLVPGVWTFFYNSRHVKATCDCRDPVPRWTDRCPLPVLAIVLWAGLSAPMMVLKALTGHLVMPVFGFLASGPVASILYLLFALIWVLSGVLSYRLDVRGWWLLLVSLLMLFVSSMITYSFHGLDEMYRLMGYPENTVEMIGKMGLFKGHMLMWCSAVFFLPVLGYLVWIKRWFRTAQPV